MLEKVINDTEIPITQFIPTHVERTPELFKAAMAFARKGGLIDLTTSNATEKLSGDRVLCCGALLKKILNNGISIENVSFSSDGQGSLPIFDNKGDYLGLGVGEVSSLFNEVKKAVKQHHIPLDTALKVITSNPARNLKLPNKGKIAVGKDADFVLLDSDLEIDTVIARGQVMVRDTKVMVKGTFEN